MKGDKKDCRKCCHWYSEGNTGRCREEYVVAVLGRTPKKNLWPSVGTARSKDSPCGPEAKLWAPW